MILRLSFRLCSNLGQSVCSTSSLVGAEPEGTSSATCGVSVSKVIGAEPESTVSAVRVLRGLGRFVVECRY